MELNYLIKIHLGFSSSMQRKEKIVIKNPAFFGLIGRELSFKMTLVPSGWYLRGSHESNSVAKSYEMPNHKVKIQKPFWMMETQITEDLYAFLNPKFKNHSKNASFPVRNICWYDAIRFCNALSELCSLPPCYFLNKPSFDAEDFETTKVNWKHNQGFRLPTESEWEWAAKAISTTPFAGSTKLSDVGYNSEHPSSQVFEVANLRPNNWGLYDMSGNVFEWCWDWYGAYSKHIDNEGFVDPRGPDIGTERVVRGGSYRSKKDFCRVTSRHHIYPTSVLDFLGFRCVLQANGKALQSD
jgi:formylglycine-generating enzyme